MITARLNERLPKERKSLYGSLRIVAEQPRWHELAVCDAAPLLGVFKSLEYVGSLEQALYVVEKQNIMLKERVLELVRLLC